MTLQKKCTAQREKRTKTINLLCKYEHNHWELTSINKRNLVKSSESVYIPPLSE